MRVKLKIVDIIAIGLFLFIAGSAYLFLSRKPSYVNVTLRVLNDDAPDYEENRPPAWYIEKLHVGDNYKNELGKVEIEVVDVYRYPSPNVLHDAYITLKVRAIKNNSTQQYLFRGTPLLINETRSFQLKDILLNGVVMDISDQEPETKEFIMTFVVDPSENDDIENTSQTVIEGVENHVAEAIVKDMKMLDSRGQTIAQVVDVNKSMGTRSFVGPQGYYAVPDPTRTKVVVTMKIVAEKINDSFYFLKRTPLIVNQKLYLSFDTIRLNGTILTIEPVEK